METINMRQRISVGYNETQNLWWGAFRVADCCTFSLKTLLFLCWDQIFSAGTRKNGKFWVILGGEWKKNVIFFLLQDSQWP
jgi:hypothetical protein